ncbi:MAG: zf-HC2 domain-containing protein, partial [bacterium]
MKCENIRLLLTAYLIGEPDAALKKTVEEHLETCCDCRASLQKIRSTLDLVQGALAATQKAPARLSPEQRKRVLSTRPAAPVSWLTVHRPMVARVAAVLVAGFVVISVVTHMLSYRVRSVIGGAACNLGSDLSKGDEALLPMMPPSEFAPASTPVNAGDIDALQSLGYAGPNSGKPANEQPNDRDSRSRRG